MRPYLAGADVVVAPLRIARGVQNKVLEAMAMARPVVATGAAFEGIDAEPGRALRSSRTSAEAMADRDLGLLDAADSGARDRRRGPASRDRALRLAATWRCSPPARSGGVGCHVPARGVAE